MFDWLDIALLSVFPLAWLIIALDGAVGAAEMERALTDDSPPDPL